jgi:hypothetical protein
MLRPAERYKEKRYKIGDPRFLEDRMNLFKKTKLPGKIHILRKEHRQKGAKKSVMQNWRSTESLTAAKPFKTRLPVRIG